MLDPVSRKRRHSWRTRVCTSSATEVCAYIKNKMPSADVDALRHVLRRFDFTIFKHGSDYMSESWMEHEQDMFGFYIVLPLGHIYKSYRHGEKYGDQDIKTGCEWADRRIKTYLSIMGMYKEDGNEQRMG